MLQYRKFYMTLNLRELRRRQSLITAQIGAAIKAISEKRYGWQRYERGLIKLQRIDLLLADVVGRKYCPEPKQQPELKPSICMRLPCEECGVRYDIPEDKMDNFNIYFRRTANGVELTPRLLCPTCTDKFVAKLDRR